MYEWCLWEELKGSFVNSPSSTKTNPDDQRWLPDQRTADLQSLAKCQVSQAPIRRGLGLLVPYFLFSAVPARARRSLAAALSTRLLRRGSCG